MRMNTMKIKLTVICLNPPPEDWQGQPTVFGLQDKDQRVIVGVPRPALGARALAFTCELDVKAGDDSMAIFSGAFAHRPPKDRHLYVSYKRAAPDASEWIRRIKISLTDIAWEFIESAARDGKTLEATFSALDRTNAQVKWIIV